MGKQIANAPKSKKVKKMFGGGMARPINTAVPAEMQRGRPGAGGPPPTMVNPKRPMPGQPMPMPGMRPMPMPGGVRGMAGPKPAPMPGRPQLMAKGGKVTRADGCCMKGKTKGKMC